tara:strand:+ start:2012 stop:2581 length:570 start_codon:yes stop_codon:yes gene_type:complete
MMQRNIVIISIVLGFFIFLQSSISFIFSDKPLRITILEDETQVANEKFITAEILSNSLNKVYKLFQINLSSQINQNQNQESSIPFLSDLTELLTKLEIKTILIKPKTKDKKGNNTLIPYELVINCSFEKFGKLITELESSERLIEIEEFNLDNGLERIRSTNKEQQLKSQDITLKISTITLNKVKGKKS